MKRFLIWTLGLSVLLAVLAALGGLLLWDEIASHPEVSISINGEELPLHELGALHWASLLFAAGITALVLMVVVPLALLLGLGLPLMIVGGALCLALMLALGVGALVGSPLILLLLLLWWLLRGRSRTAATPPYKPQEPSGPVTPQ